MSSTTLLRLATRTPASNLLRAQRTPLLPVKGGVPLKFVGCSKSLSTHSEESFEEFTARYEKEFDAVQDVFELQRNLNNAFAYDLVPSPSVITAAVKAARRVNDFPTAVRIFEGIKAKVENKGQYDEYIRDLKPLREELGITLQEELYPEPS